jgi:hypothetical protein
MAYSIDATTWRSPTHGPRTSPPSSIVVHSCEGRLPSPRDTSLPWLCNAASGVSTHYYVCRSAEIYQLVDDMQTANHAGGHQLDGTWTAQPVFSNPRSLGIELEHRAGQDWPGVQIDALGWLLRTLSPRYHIPPEMIETHGQIAIKGPYSRKSDPTNWPHGMFVSWRNALFAPPKPSMRYRAVTCAPIFQDRRPDAPLAGAATTGQVEAVDDITAGWLHLSSGLGFSPISCWQAV